ncbi:MAG: hypothetical protein ACOCRO_05660 [Halanaerobiales bacterium]
MDKVVSKIVALGVPGVVLFLAISASGMAGAAAVTTALAAIGPGSLVGGVVTLGLTVLILDALSEYGFEKLMEAILKEFRKKGMSRQDIIKKIESYPLTKGMKLKLINKMMSYCN